MKESPQQQGPRLKRTVSFGVDEAVVMQSSDCSTGPDGGGWALHGPEVADGTPRLRAGQRISPASRSGGLRDGRSGEWWSSNARKPAQPSLVG
jgi:hypothetical protein